MASRVTSMSPAREVFGVERLPDLDAQHYGALAGKLEALAA